MVTSEIHVETYRLEQYAARLAGVNSRISRIDLQMDSLYTKVGLKGLKSLIKADILTGYNQKLRRCQKYLSQTAADFEKVERELNKYDPLSFQKPVGTVRASVAKAVYNVGAAVKKSADKVTSLVKKTVGCQLLFPRNGLPCCTIRKSHSFRCQRRFEGGCRCCFDCRNGRLVHTCRRPQRHQRCKRHL